MYIIGAGMAGLLAGAINQTATILEANSKLPDNHQAVFRMRSNRIGHYLGIPFEEIQVHKAIWFEGEERQISPRLAHYYSAKVTGKITQRSILNAESPVTRWIPPKNFVDLLAERCKGRIQFGQKIQSISPERIYIRAEKRDRQIDRKNTPIISTMPMPVLQRALHDYDIEENAPKFNTAEIFINHIEIKNCDTYATIYYPEPEFSVYRATIDKNILITEGIKPMSVRSLDEVKESLGITEKFHFSVLQNSLNVSKKISAISSEERHRIIYNATTGHGVYSLGRYATWRPKVMLDDVFEDIFVIKKLLAQDQYTKRNYKQGE